MKLWMVAKFVAETEKGIVWEFAGLFDSEDAAVAACFESTYSVVELEVNEPVPQERQQFPVCWYPHLESRPQ